jgi:tetratricopeptide (TPR) repeat protein
MKRLSLLVLAVLAVPCVASADVIRLKDGSSLEGDIHRNPDGYTITQASGVVVNVPQDRVAGIDVKPTTGADAAMGRFQSLRRAADNIADIKQILERYRSFIEQNPGTPAAASAQKEITLWQDRLDKGMVKVGDKWMSADDRDALRGKSTDTAIMLHDLMKAGKLKEAGTLLDRALQIDPQNISLLYLHGVLTYQQELIPASRKAFEAVIATAQDHAPTLNNLGVILWRQKAMTAALGYYDRALLAAPANREILDNIAEALNALPKEQRDTLVVKKIVRHFKEQDDVLQKKMAGKGLYRWGADWVTEKELKKLQDQEKAIKDQIKQMELDFTSVQQRIAALDQQIGAITNEMQLLDSQTYAVNGAGQPVRLPYPPLYFTLGQQLAGLRTERAQRVDDLDRLRKNAKATQAQLPTPKYTGIQKIIDADGLPLPAGAVLPPPPAAPQPPAAAPGGAPIPPPATQPRNPRVPL